MARAVNDLSGRDIIAETQKFRGFADSYQKFVMLFENEKIYTEEPPENSCGAVAAHLLEGRYLLHAFGYQFEKNICEEVTFRLIELFGEHLPVQKESLAHIQEVFSSGNLNPVDFVITVFRNRGDRFLEILREHGFEEDLATFFAVYLTRLFRVKAAQHLCDRINFFDMEDWGKGYCPVCGHWPALAHVDKEAEKRTLWCVNCGTTWPFGSLECIYCLNEDEEELTLIGPDDETSLRVQVCSNCREYVKEIHSDVPVIEFPFDTYFMGTHALDFFARGQGFIHESPLIIEKDDATSEAHLLTHRMRLPWDH